MLFDTSNNRRTFIKNISAAGISSIAGAGLLQGLQAQTISNAGDGTNATILFQGDSITDGNRTRNNDWNHIMGHGYAYLIASRLWYEHPKKNFHFINRGVSGNTIADLATRWQTDTIDIKPDVLSILVGINDVDGLLSGRTHGTVEDFEKIYRTVLKETKEKLPATRFVICEPFILPVGRVKERWSVYSNEMKKYQAILPSIAAAFGAIYLPLQEEFNNALKKAPAEYWIWDGIHPMPAGHELIARKWITMVKRELSYLS
jgi:lysophospholipase L1-like esterase